MNETTIYKLDSKGKLRFITISTKGNLVLQTSGLVGTDSPVTAESECIAKNVGRANATTAEEQAVSEANAKLKKKLEEGYYRTPEDAQGGDLVLPMLAKDFKKEEKKVVYPVFVQKKYDGMRMLAIKKNGIVNLISRKGKEITTLNHIKIQLEDPSIPDNIYDGEAYSLEVGTFQEQMQPQMTKYGTK